jgi:shikimate kinase
MDLEMTIMQEHSSNIVLIGMPGAGKSTVGILLSRLTCRGFVDTDVLIQTSQGRALQDIVDTSGHLALRAMEEAAILGLAVRRSVIATGGSAVYSPAAMAHLKKHGIAVFLNVTLRTLGSRVRDFSTRGLAKRPDQGLEDLFAERFSLYMEYADVVLDCNYLTHDEVCAAIIKKLKDGGCTTGSGRSGAATE